jgi:outer membrane protein assembly factor BamB
MYRTNQSRTGRSGVDTSSEVGARQWSYNVGYGQNKLPYGPVVGYTSPGLGGVFLGDLYGTLYSFTPSGAIAWTLSLPDSIGAAPNAVGRDGSVYAPAPGGNLYAVSPNGTLEWTYSPPAGLSWADVAVATDGTIYTGNQCRVFYALNADGSVKWTYSGFQRDCSLFAPTVSPALGADGTIYGGVHDGEFGGVLFALDPSGGNLLWKSTAYAGTPAVASGGTLYVISLDLEHLYALNASGALQWQVNPPFDAEFTLPALASYGTIYVGTAGSGLWAINPDGSIKWKASPGGSGYFFSPPTIAGDGAIYVATNSLLAVNPDGSLKWSQSLCNGGGNSWSDEPVIGLDGTLYVILDGPYSNPCPLEAFR